MKNWTKEKIATRKAHAALPGCSTPGCKGKAIGLAWGSHLCPKCRAAEKAGGDPRTLPSIANSTEAGSQFVEKAMTLLQAEIEQRDPQRSLLLNQVAQTREALP